MEITLYKGEWYVWSLFVFWILTVLLMPKKNLTWVGVLVTFGVTSSITWFCDTLIGSAFDLFDLSKTNAVELSDSILVTFVPACIVTVYVNYLDLKRKWVYAFFFTLLSFGLEWVLVKVGYMRNKNWNTLYSIPVYFIFFAFFFPWLLRMISKKEVNLR
ncbi:MULTISPECIES: hypothetical protein [unclassified Paenibacillus]|uniref:hypothetical protein n=1 Tax=unclassified Paenibacillus TaxID=185978 RepID=UPI00278162C7|nr:MULTISPECIES: hypothetical protein [unclassified Paenibacillus]MDQ0899279.1 hypothetical protein [Paenibacillus sp. V4I7]MDQ0914716.1 hypothetical protein [Paenibacillus sp. V4I5]